MSIPIQVDAYSGYRVNERPQRFTLEGAAHEITAIEDRWYEPGAESFKVRTADARTYILHYDLDEDEWTLQGGPAERIEQRGCGS